MIKFKHAGLALLVFVAAIGCGGNGNDTGEKVELKFTPEEGRTYKTGMNITSETKMMGMSVPFTINISYSMLPTSVNDSFSTVEVTYDKIYMKMENPMTGAVEYDSDSPSVAKGMGAEKIREVYDGMVGKTFSAKFDKHGKVLETANPGNSINKTMGSMGTSTDMSQYLENLIATFPDHPVGKGDSWEKTVVTGNDDVMTINSKYTVEKVTPETVELSVEGTVEPTKSDTSEQTITFTGELNGNLVVDRNTGWTNSGTLNQNMDMEISQGMRKMTGKAENKIVISSE